MSTKSLKKQLMAAIAMVLVAAVALGSSTYAWFVNNTQVTATDVNVTATTAYSLQIKHYKDGAYSTTTPLNTGNVQLVPVSTIGGTAQNNISFYRSNEWDKDANVKTFLDATVTNTSAGTVATAITDDLTSKPYVNGNDLGSPYYVDTVYMKAGQTSKLYFDASTTGLVTKASTTGPLTASKFSTATGDTAEILKAMRIGVLISDENGSNGQFYVYQLNSTPSTQAVNTTATTLTAASANGLTAGVMSTTDTAEFTTANIANFDSGLPVLDDQAVTASATALADSAATSGKTPLYQFTVTGNTASDKSVCKAVIYIWMEGCDYDTVAANTVNFAKFASEIQLGFCLGE